MSRDQRVTDNWALLHAQQLALERRVPLAVVFTLADSFLGATLRQFGFMLRGLAQVAARLHDLNIPFILLQGNPPDEVCRFVRQQGVGTLVTDFDPLRIKRAWREEAARGAGVACIEVMPTTSSPAGLHRRSWNTAPIPSVRRSGACCRNS